MFFLKDLKSYFKWECRSFGVFLDCRENCQFFFSPLLKQVCLFFVLSCSFQFSVLRSKQGKRGEGKGNHGLPCFPSFSGLAQAASSALSCAVTPSVTLCKVYWSKCRCAGNFCLHSVPLCLVVLSGLKGDELSRLVQVLKDEDKVT